MAFSTWEQEAGARPEQSLYSLLHVNLLATEDEIRQQFRRLALRWHPDRRTGCPQRFRAIREAFEVLSDPARRRDYDVTLVRELDMQEYLNRFNELVLTVQGVTLPLHRASLHRSPRQARPQPLPAPHTRRRGCHAQHHARAHHAPQMHAHSSPMWGGLLTRA